MTKASDDLADALYGLPSEYGPVKHATREELRTLAREAEAMGAKRALEVTDAQLEAASRAMFEAGGLDEGDYSWADVVRDEPSRAELWRNDARQVLEAARAEQIGAGE